MKSAWAWAAAALLLVGCGAGRTTAAARPSRIAIKQAQDADAGQISLVPKSITVEQLAAMKLPDDYKGNVEASTQKRIGTFEKSTYQLSGTLKTIEHKKDGDFYMVVAGKSGTTAVVEVPDPDLMKNSPLHDKVAEARRELEDKYHPEKAPKTIDEPITVQGVGFYGFRGRPGAAGSKSAPRLMPGTGVKLGG